MSNFYTEYNNQYPINLFGKVQSVDDYKNLYFYAKKTDNAIKLKNLLKNFTYSDCIKNGKISLGMIGLMDIIDPKRLKEKTSETIALIGSIAWLNYSCIDVLTYIADRYFDNDENNSSYNPVKGEQILIEFWSLFYDQLNTIQDAKDFMREHFNVTDENLEVFFKFQNKANSCPAPLDQNYDRLTGYTIEYLCSRTRYTFFKELEQEKINQELQVQTQIRMELEKEKKERELKDAVKLKKINMKKNICKSISKISKKIVQKNFDYFEAFPDVVDKYIKNKL